MPSMTLAHVAVNRATLPPRVIVYGDHGIGKTTFATQAPDPIVLRTEDGLAALQVPTFPKAESYGDIIQALNALLTEPHDFRTLVLDSLDWLEPLVWAQTAVLGGKSSIEDFGYGKGYKFADEQWVTILGGLDALRAQRRMMIILLAHCQIKRFDAPDTDPYDRYQIKLHDRAANLVQEWADVVGFAHYEVHTVSQDAGFNQKTTRGIGVGRRLLSLEERPAYDAKNRYQLPADLPLSFAAFAEACAPAFAAPAPAPIAPVPDVEIVTEKAAEPAAA